MGTTPTKPDATKPPEKKEEKKELSQAEKDSILREAVSWYLRNDFRVAEIREVCEEFIAGVDQRAREGSAPQQHQSTTHSKKS